MALSINSVYRWWTGEVAEEHSPRHLPAREGRNHIHEEDLSERVNQMSAPVFAGVQERAAARPLSDCSCCRLPMDGRVPEDEEGDIEEWRAVMPPCRHTIHRGCIVNWMNSGGDNASQCPTCRVALGHEDHWLNRFNTRWEAIARGEEERPEGLEELHIHPPREWSLYEAQILLDQGVQMLRQYIERAYQRLERDLERFSELPRWKQVAIVIGGIALIALSAVVLFYAFAALFYGSVYIECVLEGIWTVELAAETWWASQFISLWFTALVWGMPVMFWSTGKVVEWIRELP